MATAVNSKVLDAVFGALAHPTRRQILVILHARGGEMSAGQIADRFKHSWPTITRHLGVLEQARILVVGKSGRQRFYALRPELAVRAADWLLSWSTPEDADTKSDPLWKDLSYARMRNAIAPKPGKGRKRDSD